LLRRGRRSTSLRTRDHLLEHLAQRLLARDLGLHLVELQLAHVVLLPLALGLELARVDSR